MIQAFLCPKHGRQLYSVLMELEAMKCLYCEESDIDTYMIPLSTNTSTRHGNEEEGDSNGN